MKRFPTMLLLVAAGALPLSAQDFTGQYVYHPVEGGVVTLELEQTGVRVTGSMTGMDGSVNRLEGALEQGNAVGSIRTQNGSGWFAAGHVAGGLRLIVAPVDPSTGQPDLANGWQLDFTRTAAAGGVAAAAPAPGGKGVASPAQGDSYATPRAQQQPQQQQPAMSSPLVTEWQQHLAGKKVTWMDSYASGGGSGGYSNRAEAFICSDGTFHYRSSSSVSADVGGAFGGGSSSDSFTGRWRIVEHNGQALLQYQTSQYAGSDQGQWIALGFQNGQTFFDGERVYVTNDNSMCR